MVIQKAEEINAAQTTNFRLVPEDWDVVQLEQVAELIMGQSPPSETYNNEGVGLPFLQGKAEFGDIYPEPRKWCSKPIKIAKERDVLISVRAPVGDINVAPFECCIGRGLAAVRAKGRLEPLYLFYYLLTAKEKLESEGRGTTFKAIGRSVLETFKLPLPALPEQQKIAFVLSKIQQAIEQQDKIIEATRNLKKSLMQKLFTEGIGHTEFKDSEIGQIPKSWEIVTLGDVAQQQKDSILPSEIGDSVYIGLKHIDPGSPKLNRFGSSKEVRSSKFRFYPNDILYGKLRTYLDKAVLAEFDGVCSTDIIVIKTADRCLPGFLVNLLHRPNFVRYATSTMTGVNHPRTSWSSLSKFKMALPPLSEQQEIAHTLTVLEKKLYVEEKKKSTLQHLFKTMLHKLMTGEIRVKDIDLDPGGALG